MYGACLQVHVRAPQWHHVMVETFDGTGTSTLNTMLAIDSSKHVTSHARPNERLDMLTNLLSHVKTSLPL